MIKMALNNIERPFSRVLVVKLDQELTNYAQLTPSFTAPINKNNILNKCARHCKVV